ncbi:hypothetical protein CUMW_198810, partial [Citrus unshiu]
HSKASSYFHEVNIPDLSYSQIHGKFDLSYNTLSSLIFEELGSCVVLVYLLLSNNMLSDSWITLETNKPNNLGLVWESTNQFHSTRIWQLSQALRLLTGSIPRSLGYLSGLVKLNLLGNKLSDLVPTSFGNLNGLIHSNLS